jgi:cytochrome b involved in lipid metabolism|uniref:Microsomal cytochrome b5 n=1 Tax=Phaeodactylum tricornutum TaxID=2850 RepID=Q8LKV0_PHATR|nr:microsomal cytochrome b5 [Phaeodactylum tricornutum]
MSAEKEYTLDEISQHTTTESCWLIIGNASNGGPKVYDVTKYLDDHPGGAEVMLDVAGQDADEFFEDIGHSKEARAELKNYLVGNFKIDAATLAKMKADAEAKAQQKNSGTGIMLIVLMALFAIAYGYYQTQMK